MAERMCAHHRRARAEAHSCACTEGVLAQALAAALLLWCTRRTCTGPVARPGWLPTTTPGATVQAPACVAVPAPVNSSPSPPVRALSKHTQHARSSH